jgi:hypothetical protein
MILAKSDVFLSPLHNDKYSDATAEIVGQITGWGVPANPMVECIVSIVRTPCLKGSSENEKKHEITNGLLPEVFRHCLEASPALNI